MPRQPAPVAVPIASYIGRRIRLLAICDDCWNVATLDPVALLDRHGRDFTTADLKARLRCGRCESRNTVLQVNGSPEGLLAGHDGTRRAESGMLPRLLPCAATEGR